MLFRKTIGTYMSSVCVLVGPVRRWVFTSRPLACVIITGPGGLCVFAWGLVVSVCLHGAWWSVLFYMGPSNSCLWW